MKQKGTGTAPQQPKTVLVNILYIHKAAIGDKLNDYTKITLKVSKNLFTYLQECY